MNMDEIIKAAKEILLEQGVHHPTVFVEVGNPTELLLFVLDTLPPQGEREHFLSIWGRTLGYTYPQRPVLHVVLIMEAWYRALRQATSHRLPPPSASRREVLLVLQLDARTREQTGSVVEMIRDSEGTLRDLIPESQPTEARGQELLILLEGILA